MASDSCLQFFRWFCCCFIVASSLLGCLIGVLVLAVGVLMLWGHAVLSSLTQVLMQELNSQLKQVFGSDISVEGLINGVSQMAGVAAIVLIVLGLVIIVVSCVGCWGACCGVPACLIIYSVLVGLLFAAQLILVIIWFADQNLLKRGVRSGLDKYVSEYEGLRSTNVQSLTMNTIQIFVGCCGVRNGSDYDANTKWNRTYTFRDSNNNTVTFNLTYPVSCCKFTSNMRIEDPYCPYNGTAAVSNFGIGCYDRIFAVADQAFKLDNAFYILCGFMGLQSWLVIGALLICCAVRRYENPPQSRDQGYKMQPMA